MDDLKLRIQQLLQQLNECVRQGACYCTVVVIGCGR